MKRDDETSATAASAHAARGLDAHRGGRLDEAERHYLTALRADADHLDSRYLLGILLAGSGRAEDALEHLDRAVDLAPDRADPALALAHARAQTGDGAGAAVAALRAASLAGRRADVQREAGRALLRVGAPLDAAECFDRALALAPRDLEALCLRGTLYQQAGDPGDAARCYRAALEGGATHPEVRHQLGLCLLETREREAALAAFDRVLALAPEHIEACSARARALLELGRLGEAETALDTLLATRPDHPTARRLRGFVRMHRGRFEEAAEDFMQPVRARYDPARADDAGDEAPPETTHVKLRHDAEQIEHLIETGRLPGHDFAIARAHRDALAALPAPDAEHYTCALPEVPGLGAQYNRLHHDAPAARVEGDALRPGLDGAGIERELERSSIGCVWVDDFLAPQALEALRRYCREATVWLEASLRNEVGTSLRSGFCCPLLLQIAGAVRERLPRVYGRHLFTNVFAYKYYRSDRDGHVHADRGAMSVNLWITPDEANEDPDSGGLVVWNKRVPPEWFTAPPEHADAIERELLAAHDAHALRIPYRCNRAMLFRSDVLHENERMRFRDDYPSRRVSITFLFGRPGD